MKRDLLSVADLTPDEAVNLLEQALVMKKGGMRCLLPWRSVALLFEKPSLRTRVSFDLAVTQLGGHSLYLSPQEVGLGQREPVADVARVLSRYVDCIVARVNHHETLEELARYSSVSVINALSDWEHPCQALADLLTVRESFGTLNGTKLAFVGDGNNVARSLALLCAMVGVDFSIASPEEYSLDVDTLSRAAALAGASGAHVYHSTDPVEVVRGAQIVYTDTWTSMGQEDEAAERRRHFAGYQVNAALLHRAGRPVYFMHCLPAHHGEEVTSDVFDSPSSLVFDQAENRLHVQKALLAQILIPAG
ncbi:ornithine carbamoyltransferase [candidate division WOR-3 bacterium]|nr:ornithine carbamoyltransferase [candidate division WOR-3 bacterium]